MPEAASREREVNKLRKQRGKIQYFTEAPFVINAGILTGPHELACTDYEKFANIVRNISGRILKFNETEHEPSDQYTTNLFFQ